MGFLISVSAYSFPILLLNRFGRPKRIDHDLGLSRLIKLLLSLWNLEFGSLLLLELILIEELLDLDVVESAQFTSLSVGREILDVLGGCLQACVDLALLCSLEVSLDDSSWLLGIKR